MRPERTHRRPRFTQAPAGVATTTLHQHRCRVRRSVASTTSSLEIRLLASACVPGCAHALVPVLLCHPPRPLPQPTRADALGSLLPTAPNSKQPQARATARPLPCSYLSSTRTSPCPQRPADRVVTGSWLRGRHRQWCLQLVERGHGRPVASTAGALGWVYLDGGCRRVGVVGRRRAGRDKGVVRGAGSWACPETSGNSSTLVPHSMPPWPGCIPYGGAKQPPPKDKQRRSGVLGKKWW